jgi:hypothetical protein
MRQFLTTRRIVVALLGSVCCLLCVGLGFLGGMVTYHNTTTPDEHAQLLKLDKDAKDIATKKIDLEAQIAKRQVAEVTKVVQKTVATVRRGDPSTSPPDSTPPLDITAPKIKANGQLNPGPADLAVFN